MAEAVRKYPIPDFSNLKNHDAFARAFARREKDLRTSSANNRPGRDNRKLARHEVSGNVPNKFSS
ncbi:MAG: hypothetical protein WCS42_15360 [Verrucomicrobiota bacterium]